MNVYTQNSTTYTLKFVHFIVYSLTKKIKSPNGKTKNKHTHTKLIDKREQIGGC